MARQFVYWNSQDKMTVHWKDQVGLFATLAADYLHTNLTKA